MADPLLHVGATLQCSHGGRISVLSNNTRVKVNGQPVALADDSYPIAGCPQDSACTQMQVLTPAQRVRVNGRPVVLQSSTCDCRSGQAPKGTPLMLTVQTRVRGS